MSRSSVYLQPGAVPAQYEPGFFVQEFAKIAQAIMPNVVRKITTSTTQFVSDALVLAYATTAPLTYTLLSPSAATRFPVDIKKMDATANAVTLVGTVDGVVNPTIVVQYTSLTLWSDGTVWSIV